MSNIVLYVYYRPVKIRMKNFASWNNLTLYINSNFSRFQSGLPGTDFISFHKLFFTFCSIDVFILFQETHLSQAKIKILVDSSPGKNKITIDSFPVKNRVILLSPGNKSKWVLSLPGKNKAILLSPGKNKEFPLSPGKANSPGKTNSKDKLIPLSLVKALWVSKKWRLHTSAIVSGKKWIPPLQEEKVQMFFLKLVYNFYYSWK